MANQEKEEILEGSLFTYPLDDFPLDLIKAKVKDSEKDLPLMFEFITASLIRLQMRDTEGKFEQFRIYVPIYVQKQLTGLYTVNFRVFNQHNQQIDRSINFNYPVQNLNSDNLHNESSFLVGSLKGVEMKIIGSYKELLDTASEQGKSLEEYLDTLGYELNQLVEVLP